jgi:hypothetical protein
MVLFLHYLSRIFRLGAFLAKIGDFNDFSGLRTLLTWGLKIIGKLLGIVNLQLSVFDTERLCMRKWDLGKNKEIGIV